MPAGSFFTQTLDLEEATVKIEIWDTAGQEKYHSVCHLYYRDAHAALLVYDIANKVRQDQATPRDDFCCLQSHPRVIYP